MINLSGIQENPDIENPQQALLHHGGSNTKVWSDLNVFITTLLQHTNTVPYHDNATGKWMTLDHLEPYTLRRTLRVTLTLNGSASSQIMTYLQKIAIFKGKLFHCHLPNGLIWKAIKIILEPSILYLLMATPYTVAEIECIEKQMAILYCHALGLNEYFPRAALYGPAASGDMQSPSIQSMLTATQINFFLYHTW